MRRAPVRRPGLANVLELRLNARTHQPDCGPIGEQQNNAARSGLDCQQIQDLISLPEVEAAELNRLDGLEAETAIDPAKTRGRTVVLESGVSFRRCIGLGNGFKISSLRLVFVFPT